MQIKKSGMRKWTLLTIGFLFFGGCTLLKDLVNVKRPALAYSNVSIQSINFSEAVLLFDFDVNNPNNVGITADRYSYEFFVNDNSFISGDQQENIRIERESTSTLQVPVTLRFSELVNTFDSLLRNDQFAYKINTAFEFDIPGLGNQTLPINASGEFPMPKVPQIEFGGFDVKELSLSGAEMEISLNISNPNIFPVSLLDADYTLEVNGKNWLDASLGNELRVSPSGSQDLIIPVRLNSSQMGSVLIDMMRGNAEFEYRLTGNANVGAEIEGTDFRQTIPFNMNGIFRD